MKKKILEERGSMAVYVTIVLLSFIIILSAIYATASSSRRNQLRTAMKIKESYEMYNNKKSSIYNSQKKKIKYPAGTVIDKPSDWTSKNITPIADGNAGTVPLPSGFYYVGGDISTGLVISDKQGDTLDASGTSMGNQFVWIPVEANNYKKMDLGKANANWEKQTNTAELPQIQKYGGFYIGRYEAGTSEITLSTGIDFAGQNTASGWQNSKFSIRNGLNQTSTGKITQKAGEIPYYHADYETALKLCNDMYQTEYIQSGLVTGTMWDAMMKFIAGGDDRIITSLSSWGNYNNGNVKYTIGNGRYAEINPDNGEMTSKFTTSDGQYHYGINTTAMSEDVKKKNIYDAAGNLWEWTQEASYPNNKSESYMLHGGSFKNSFSVNPACYRGYGAATGTHTTRGFRPALYIK